MARLGPPKQYSYTPGDNVARVQASVAVPVNDTGEATPPKVLTTYPAHPDGDMEEESDMDESQGVSKGVSRGGEDGPSTTAWVVPKAGSTRKAHLGMGWGRVLSQL